ncbi:conserved hypothetical protein [Histoplasma capsulatum H143]|uniref:dolichol kinase n=1 Tax=Ajellomyces capsulatus (strain H143) TaxID=544712 RepID=C6H318_AJECH|nr:conserved hypothetical protein [Histoplasma capsulatum H143]
MATQDARRGNGESLDSHEPLLIAPSFLDSRQQLSRSPRPYSRRGSSLITPMDNVESGNYTTSRGKSSITSSESGTEADDESTGFLKGLPAPQIRPRQTLSLGKWNAQGKREGLTGEKLWSAFRRSRLVSSRRDSSEDACVVVYFGKDVRYSARAWNGELSTFSITILVLYLIYPFQITTYGFRRRRWKAIVALPFSTNLDPAPLIYPVLLPVLIALSLIHNHQVSILPNIILGLSSIPSPVIPFYTIRHGFVITHWAITILPVITSNIRSRSSEPFQGLNPELLLLIFPLHQALVTTLHFFSTTSLLHTELQLLATGLLNVLFFANSSQGEILKALLWLGGICMLFLCQHVLRWEVILARIPSWKFRRSPRRDDRRGGYLKMLDHNICYSLSHVGHDGEALSDSDVPVSGLQ